MARDPKSLRQKNSPSGSGSPMVRRRIAAAARDIEKDCRISARCHFSAATFWYTVYYVIGLPTTVLAAVAGVAALREYTLIAGIFAISVAALAATNTFLNAGERAHAHSKKRAQYEELKNAARFFREVTISITDKDADLVKELARHARTRNILNRESPQVREKFFIEAAGAIAGEDLSRRAPPQSEPRAPGVVARVVSALTARPGRSQPG
jgi:hypothetical protein